MHPNGASRVRSRSTVPPILLDDDPTGSQLSHDVAVLLDEGCGGLAAALSEAPGAVHIITNTRAMSPAAAYERTRSAAERARQVAPGSRLVLRGDSTLRGHLLEEYDAVRDVAYPGEDPALLLVPAMPSEGRVTLGGVHYCTEAGLRVPVSSTAYARDGLFSFDSSRLLDYAEQRSAGRFPASKGVEVRLADLLDGGADVIASALATAAGNGPAVVSVDSVTMDHLQFVLDGIEAAEAQGVSLVTRCSPALASLLAGGTDPAVGAPTAEAGVLVVVGSYVANTTAQLERLVQRTGTQPIEVDVGVLSLEGIRADAEVHRAATAAGALLSTEGLAVLATPRYRSEDLNDLDSGAQIARSLARIAGRVDPRPSVVITKGGITSAVTLQHGFGVSRARVEGAITTGVSLWDAGTERPAFVVFPGNVGDGDTLADVALMCRGDL